VRRYIPVSFANIPVPTLRSYVRLPRRLSQLYSFRLFFVGGSSPRVEDSGNRIDPGANVRVGIEVNRVLVFGRGGLGTFLMFPIGGSGFSDSDSDDASSVASSSWFSETCCWANKDLTSVRLGSPLRMNVQLSPSDLHISHRWSSLGWISSFLEHYLYQSCLPQLLCTLRLLS
jgi:hypothetical protein